MGLYARVLSKFSLPSTHVSSPHICVQGLVGPRFGFTRAVQINTVLAKPEAILDDLGYKEMASMPLQKIRDSDHLYLVMKNWEDASLAR